ncbi:MAG TPA: hypothetical protein VND92_11465 [Vicinamibacterales bacterium]|nr:hypothetical protein [Vicinamibacterales bacterium]
MDRGGKTEPGVQPRDGDILLTSRQGGDPRFTVSVVPGPAQVAFASYRKALRVARTFARDHRAALWVQNAAGPPRPFAQRRATREDLSARADEGMKRSR